MNVRNILLILTVILSLSACEKEIDIASVNISNRITVNALISPDTTIMVYLTECDDLDYFGTIALRSDYTRYNTVHTTGITENSLELLPYILTKANVEVIVNNEKTYSLVYNPEYISYSCDYVPNPGDEIQIQATSMCKDSIEIKELSPIFAVTHVPSKPKIEIIETEVKYKEREYYEVEDFGANVLISDYYGSDTVMSIKMRIEDPGDERNFYCLKIRSVGAYTVSDGMGHVTTWHTWADMFSSGDELFYDSDLVKPYRFLPAYFSDVFEDELINGKEYELTVETRLRRNSTVTPYVIVELQHLSPDLYYYLKDIEIFRISDFDLYDNPIQIHTNVSGGWGVFSSMNFDTHIIPFENKRYE